jgi:predicted exporter
MKRLLAVGWLILLCILALHLAWRFQSGINFSTDILALLPREAETPFLERVNQQVTDHFSHHVVLLVGDRDPAKARAAAQALTTTLRESGLLQMNTSNLNADQLKRMGALYFPYRRGLLSEHDRALLLAGEGQDIVNASLAQIYGFAAMTDAKLIIADPFLLLQSFLTHLPVPLSRLTLQDGFLTVQDKDTTWILLSGQLKEEPFALDLQKRLAAVLDPTLGRLQRQSPDLQVKRLGAVFYATAGSQVALQETSTLGTISTIGSIILLLLVFRRVGPLWQNLLVIGIGAGAALSICLLLFGQLHVVVLLFGVSLIGIAVDYGMYYYSCLFDPSLRNPAERLRSVYAGIGLGYVTTVLGYAVLILAPFPGLRQIAIFSLIGLSASFVSVILWFPILDHNRPLQHGRLLLRAAIIPWHFWEMPAGRWSRRAVVLVFVILGAMGLLRLRADDDVRHLQSLPPDLLQQQTDIQQLIGSVVDNEFLLIHAESDEAALQREEDLAPILTRQITDGALKGYHAAAAFLPSAKRQMENRQLVEQKLDQPFLAQQRQQLGLPAPVESVAGAANNVLTLDQALADKDAGSALPFLRELVLAPGIHIVTLDGLRDSLALRQAIAGFADVRLVDPTGDYTTLLGKYRYRAVWLIGLSIALMMLVLIWRYGWRGALRVKAPSVTAIIAATACIGLLGQGFTFFHVMALILVQSIGVDYAVFCAECARDKRAMTMLGVWLSALSTILSFGVLAFSQVAAVHAFGLTMLVGIVFAFLLAPLAGGAVVKRRLGRAGRA